jgi:hypothetical protein
MLPFDGPSTKPREHDMSYARFGAMIVTSTIVMFGLMYLNIYAADHVWFSQTRAWMAVMLPMYESPKTKSLSFCSVSGRSQGRFGSSAVRKPLTTSLT